MPKLIFINRYFYPDESATSQLLTDLAISLADSGYEVDVVTGRQLLDDPDAGLLPLESLNGITIHRIWTTRRGRGNLLGRSLDYLTFYFSAFFALWRLTGPQDVIIAKTDPPLIGAVGAVVARLRGASLVNWIQDVYPEVAERLPIAWLRTVSWLIRGIRNVSWRSACQNVVIGRCMRDYLLDGGIDASTIAVVPNWVNDERIRPIARESNLLRNAWGWKDEFIVGYSGNIGRGHDFERILEAAEALSEEPGIVFVFIGDGARRADLETQVIKRNLRNVFFQPYQPGALLPLSLNIPDVHVVTLQPQLTGLMVPSKFYGALAAGRPVFFVGSERSEVAQVIREASCGSVFGRGISSDMADCILELYRDEMQRARQGRLARQVLEERFCRRHEIVAWHELLEQMMDRDIKLAPSPTMTAAGQHPADAGSRSGEIRYRSG